MRKTLDILIVILVLVIGILLGRTLFYETDTSDEKYFSDGIVTIHSPALDGNGKGVVVDIDVHVMNGNGNILVNINDALADYYMQQSARLAAKAAANYSGINLSKLDVFYSIKANAGVIEGPSAGASMAIATVALFEGKELKKDVMMTGAVLEDGSITQVGGVLEKAKAARNANVTLFLVAEGLSYDVQEYERVKTCNEEGTYCKVEYVAVKKNIGEEIGIEFREVGTLKDVAEVYLK